jgi:selenocysteine lyase/cysteine desulfurase
MSGVASTALPPLCGAGLEVPLAGGGTATYVNLDMAASTPALRRVADTVAAVLPWYSSVHRGAGFASQVSTRLYESARRSVGRFVGARPDDAIVFVRNTTEAVNCLAQSFSLPPGTLVLSTAVEHHANMLPWRRRFRVVHLAPPPTAEALLQAVDEALSEHPVGLVAITGASNVTGEVFPVAEVAALAHRGGVPVFVDAAQLAPHRRIDMGASGIDALALSGHKMYAPFGSGALVARRDLLEGCEPFLAGGGAVDLVTLESVVWTSLPDRLEAGSPNVLGAVALGASCEVLAEVGMEAVAAHERELRRRLESRLDAMDHVTHLRLWHGEDVDRLGVCTFTVEGMHHALVAAALSAEWAIGVRHGCFCAHPYIAHLLGLSESEIHEVRGHIRAGERSAVPGAVRASFGIGTDEEHVDRLAGALEELAAHGPRLEYSQDPASGDFLPLGDRRSWPRFEPLGPLDEAPHGLACGQF